MALLDKIRSAKDKLERKTYQKKAESRARERRIEMGEPEGKLEEAVVTGKETRELGSQAKEFVSEATPGGGVGTEKAGGILSGIGAGAENVIDDVESGEFDAFGGEMESDGIGLGGDFGLDTGDSSGDLDMDLSEFD